MAGAEVAAEEVAEAAVTWPGRRETKAPRKPDVKRNPTRGHEPITIEGTKEPERWQGVGFPVDRMIPASDWILPLRTVPRLGPKDTITSYAAFSPVGD